MTTRAVFASVMLLASPMLHSQGAPPDKGAGLAEVKVKSLADAKTLYSNSSGASTEWADYLMDDAAGTISASGMLGIDGQSIKSVDTLRDLITAFEGFRSDDGQGTLAVAVTPGRSELARVDLASYYANRWRRLLANTSIGYAQGKQDIEEQSFNRYAASIQTTIIINDNDDLVVRYTNESLEGGECYKQLTPAYDAWWASDLSTARRATLLGELVDARAGSPGARTVTAVEADLDALPKPALTSDNAVAAVVQPLLDKCLEWTKSQIPWNRSEVTFSYGQGWIKADDDDVGGGDQHSLGRTAVVMGRIGVAKSLGLSAIYRRTWDDPVLTSLLTEEVDKRDRSLVMGRVTFGSSRLRASIEVSDAKDHDVTASHRAYKGALGLDARVFKGTWVALRVGRLREVDGDDDETSSLLSLSYSPSALLALR